MTLTGTRVAITTISKESQIVFSYSKTAKKRMIPTGVLGHLSSLLHHPTVILYSKEEELLLLAPPSNMTSPFLHLHLCEVGAAQWTLGVAILVIKMSPSYLRAVVCLASHLWKERVKKHCYPLEKTKIDHQTTTGSFLKAQECIILIQFHLSSYLLKNKLKWMSSIDVSSSSISSPPSSQYSSPSAFDRNVVVFPHRKVEDVPGIFIPHKSSSSAHHYISHQPLWASSPSSKANIPSYYSVRKKHHFSISLVSFNT
ncbi:unnamed protein product [Lepeophtheirus salmonis]|uniref:(salmon louse) hypothetical protein n=1 Tax=Lepeophtheirus salmonis TaxID=72036 RepID=A0A7R8CVP4_LEPSM|nr:unnamed protein product [Lepeophtheirus salmonis]CAF2946588.1 unnamed protein product [Lepeophtheirus salmonis]